jgi:hypothetical protein
MTGVKYRTNSKIKMSFNDSPVKNFSEESSLDDIFDVYKINEKSTNKVPWKIVALYYSIIEAWKHDNYVYWMQNMRHNHIEGIKILTKFEGPTPQNTLNKILQGWKKLGIIEYVNGDGKYRFYKHPKNSLYLLDPNLHTRGSSGEQMIARALDSLGIAYETEKTFDDLRNIGLLRYDFYFETNGGRFVVEFNGEQHYLPIEIFGGCNGLIKRNVMDKMKTQYAVMHGIRILHIRVREHQHILDKLRDMIFHNGGFQKILNPEFGIERFEPARVVINLSLCEEFMKSMSEEGIQN